MFEVQLASFAAGMVFGMMCLSAIIVTVLIILALRYYEREGEDGAYRGV